MLNFYITAVKYGVLQIDSVPSVYQEKVRGELGLTVELEEKSIEYSLDSRNKLCGNIN